LQPNKNNWATFVAKQAKDQIKSRQSALTNSSSKSSSSINSSSNSSKKYKGIQYKAEIACSSSSLPSPCCCS